MTLNHQKIQVKKGCTFLRSDQGRWKEGAEDAEREREGEGGRERERERDKRTRLACISVISDLSV